MPHPTPASITAECFPTPALILRTNDPTAQRSLRKFAYQQAEVATSLHQALDDGLRGTRDIDDRTTVFSKVFEAAEDWRYRIAEASPQPVGRYGSTWTERFRTPVTDDNPNLFRLGEHERLREGTRWDPTTRTYLRGTETPASRTMRQFGTQAFARFSQTPDTDVVRNRVTMHDGEVVHGMQLLRGNAAHRAATEMVARIAARGGDTSRIITDGHLIYVASAPEADCGKIFHNAMILLARDHASAASALTAWLQAAYLLYQAPRRKRGSDATVRTFLIAAGAYLLDRLPVLLHDIDLRAYVTPQDQFVTELRSAQDGADIHAEA
ncbi:hypothetical protein [Streptomyces sp. TRM68367]|uniref:hypothetical protein n=1 Tax=Streptomyces sp. TRM68367 TaxID=2758415 RepID=UPI00165CE2D0|nr:hypothetical protein [Streptomyces sp. TRM68367]MBC9724019.1 hypothetical protein [Streptomyces sp. TRM68367]